MKLIPLALAFAIGPFSLAAQSAVPAPSTPSSTLSVSAVGSGCPVSMQLQQRLGSQAITVQNDGRVYKAPATQLMLTIPALPSPGSAFGSGVAGMEGTRRGTVQAQPAARHTSLRVKSATAIAYGFGGRPRAELVSPGRRGNSWSGPTRNIQLRFNADDGNSVAELWLPSFGAVRWLDLDSITWSDGSTWKPAKGESCSVTPSLFMLVGANSVSASTKP